MADFPPPEFADWQALADRERKGQADRLVWQTAEGIAVKPLYTAADLERLETLGGLPGLPPYLRGPRATMYALRPWTIRQYAGFSTAEESNAFYKANLEAGQQGLSVAFDLPTLYGYDSDHEMSLGEVGKCGVAICSANDMERLFEGIPLDRVSISMTINSPAAIAYAMYLVAAERQGVDWSHLSGTIQNDILKEYAARGTYIYPPKPSMRIITDIFAYCSKEVPKWNTISISGYHIREAGSTAAQELAFTLSNGKAYLKAAIAAGLDINQFGQRLSFFFNAHNNFFEEIAKFRAARRMWAKMMKQLGATDPKAMMLRFHTQTGGSTLTAQQPHNNISRVTIQTLAAVLGGTQTIIGPIIGGMVLEALPEVLRQVQQYRGLFTGIVLLGAIVYLPNGLVDPEGFKGLFGSLFSKSEGIATYEEKDAS